MHDDCCATAVIAEEKPTTVVHDDGDKIADNSADRTVVTRTARIFWSFQNVKKLLFLFDMDIFGKFSIIALGISLAMRMPTTMHCTYTALRMAVSAPPQTQ